MKTQRVLYTLLIFISLVCLVLVCLVAARYSYSRLSTIESAGGVILLLVVTAVFWFFRNRTVLHNTKPVSDTTLILGIVLGLLWMVEISINNFITPPLPGRDIIDNIFWGLISVAILVYSVRSSFQDDSFLNGVKVGLWNGIISGLLACCMALLMIVFGMNFILHDPLNIAEWAANTGTTDASTMAAYFAFETFAGAFGHLVLIGAILSSLLGAFGGVIGKGLKLITRPK